MEPGDAARRWAQAWERAWNEHDPNLLTPVYADGCVFRSSPFREPAVPSEYVAWAFSDEESARARFAEPVVDGDRAAVEWWATVVTGDGEQTLAGCSLLRFDPGGRVIEERDYWNAADGRVQPFPGWR
jgi:SnoaL-like protein